MLSVIIPTQDCERPLVRTLALLVSAAVAGTVREVIVADGGSQDDTAQVAEIAGCTVMVSTASLGLRLRAAAAEARAGWLLFLRAGMLPDTAWADDTVRFVEDAERRSKLDAAAVFRREPLATGGSIGGQALALLKDAINRKPTPDQGLLISRRFYDALGGHRAEASDPEADLLARLGGRIVRLRTGVVMLSGDVPLE